MEVEKKLIANSMKNLTKNNSTVFMVRSTELFDKNSEKSIASRKLGNDLYTVKDHSQKIHEEIWKHYTESIAFALNKSEELAAGYANRSALLLHLSKYKECLRDIERALKTTKSCALKVKLYCREAECFVALQKGKQNSSLEKAKYWLLKVGNDQVTKLNKLIIKIEVIIKDNIPADVVERVKKRHFSCNNDAVDISYNKQNIRFLIANRDIQTGEFVYVDKFYVASVNSSKLYAYCSHCLAISWTLIPCDHCAFYMFCSQKCKAKAWEKYHDIECGIKVAQKLNLYTHCLRLSMRLLIMGIKEAGSIENLKDLVDEIDKAGDEKKREFCGNSFQRLYSLCYSNKCYADIHYETIVYLATTLLTLVYGNKFFVEAKMNVNDVTFVGSLMLRLISISQLNGFQVLRLDSGCINSDQSTSVCLVNACCSRGMHISLFTSAINHSCDGNVQKLYTNDGRVVYYAIKPIKKNAQIFNTYYINYEWTSKAIRQTLYSTLFEFDCGCVACHENWPELSNLMNRQKLKHNKSDKKLLKKYKKWEEPHRWSKEYIAELAKDIDQSLKNTKKPPTIYTALSFVLVSLMENRYFDQLKVPEKCKDKEHSTM